MKAISQNTFSSINQLCESSSKSIVMLLASRCWSALRSLPGAVRRKLQTLKQFAGQVILHGLTVSRISLSNLLRNKRHRVGLVLLVLGIFSLVAHKIFSDPFIEDHLFCSVLGFKDSQCWNGSAGWCYVSGYWYWNEVCWYVALLFWSVSLVLFIPVKYTLAFIPAAFFHAVGWCWIIHLSFFSTSYETINAIPTWPIIVVALGLGVGIVMSSDALLYWEHHKKRGNWQRWPAVHKSNIDQQLKNKLFDELTEEYYKVNRMI